MSWLSRHIKIAQNFPLSINGLTQLRESAMMSPDIPGQAYLFQNPEISEMARLRGIGSPALIDQITKMMHNVFIIFGDEIENEFDYEVDENMLEEQMYEYAEAYVTDCGTKVPQLKKGILT